jgi:DNA-directed RNA polymerase subunit E'/Rpb7
VVTVVPATIQNDDSGSLEGWGIDNADSILVGNNIEVTARIVVKGDRATVLRVAYHAVILG